MKRTKITDTIEYIEPGPTPFASTSAGLYINSTPGIMIDVNPGEEDIRKLLNMENPDIALITHYHLDHSLGGAIVESHPGTELWIPKGEVEYLTSLDHFIENTCGPCDFAEQFRIIVKNFLKYTELKEFRTYEDGDVIRSGSLSIRCIQAPGHSPSHTAFHIPEENLLFTGDIGIGNWGPWYGWVDSNIPLYIDSILRLKTLKHAKILTCHDGIIDSDIGHEWDRCLSHFFVREKNIQAQLEKGLRDDIIVEKGIYFKNKSKIAEPLQSLLTVQDRIMFKHHKALLEKGGLDRIFPTLKNDLVRSGVL